TASIAGLCHSGDMIYIRENTMPETSVPAKSVIAPSTTGNLMPDAEQRARLRKIRSFKDGVSRYGVTAAGLAVVGALGLIFFYLFSEVAPLLRSSSIEVSRTYPLETNAAQG